MSTDSRSRSRQRDGLRASCSMRSIISTAGCISTGWRLARLPAWITWGGTGKISRWKACVRPWGWVKLLPLEGGAMWRLVLLGFWVASVSCAESETVGPAAPLPTLEENRANLLLGVGLVEKIPEVRKQ